MLDVRHDGGSRSGVVPCGAGGGAVEAGTSESPRRPLRRVGVVGCGLVGGSIALRLKERGTEVKVLDIDPEVRDKASEAGLEVTSHMPDLTEGAQLVVVATPPGATARALEDVLEHAGEDLVVTDTSSVKGKLVRQLDSRGISGDRRLLLSHPMAGSAGSGFAYATHSLFEGCTWVVVSSSEPDRTAEERVCDLAVKLGAGRVVRSGPEEHDMAVAAVSHLPQVLSSMMAAVVQESSPDLEGVLRLAGGGFKDMSRLAGSPGDLWVDILQGNAENVAELLEKLESRAGRLRAALEDGDTVHMHELFGLAGRTRAAYEKVSAGSSLEGVRPERRRDDSGG